MSCEIENCDCDTFVASKLIVRQFVGLCVNCQHSHTAEQAAQREISHARVCQVGSYPVFISDFATATNATLLRESRITHVVCCCPSAFDMTKNAKRLGEKRIELEAFEDSSNQLLDRHCATSFAWIESAIEESVDNRILVHCAQGVSRSCSIVMHWLMKKHALSYDDALNLIQQTRPICNPNTSFERQLRLMAKSSSFANDETAAAADVSDQCAAASVNGAL
jgi:predicted protein tyrosine phosphatase